MTLIEVDGLRDSALMQGDIGRPKALVFSWGVFWFRRMTFQEKTTDC